MTADPLLEIAELCIGFRTGKGVARVLDRVNVSVGRGRIMGLVGESGCGKTTLARAILSILAPNAQIEGGAIRFGDLDLLALPRARFEHEVKGRRMAYIDQGTKVLTRLGLPDPAAVPAAAAEPGGAAPKADSVDGSRSAPFAVLLALFARFAALNEFVVINAVLTLVAIALPLRVARRLYGGNLALPALTAIPVLVASLGALPFYVAYLMPDIFTPVLLISLHGV